MAEPDETKAEGTRPEEKSGSEPAGEEKPAKDKRRAGKLAGFWIRAACFAVAAVLLLAYANYVFTPKHDYGICPTVTYYQQEPDTIDVLTIGTSLSYAGINTNVLWKEYGIAAYNLCGAEQPFWVSYYLLKEALKTQHPKLILLDAKPAAYRRNYSKRGRTILSTYGIRGIENRIGATLACVETPKEGVSFLLGLPEVHSNYMKLALSDFAFPPDNGGRGSTWKGYIESDATEAHEEPSAAGNKTKRSINTREAEYVRKIFELAHTEKINLVLVGLPYPDYANDYMYYNDLWAIAEKYGILCINYNDPENSSGLQYSSDFADWQHLNVKGSITFSRKLGTDLRKRFGIPDRRGDARYDSWEECAKLWYGNYPAFRSADREQQPLEWYDEPAPEEPETENRKGTET